jgi:hypothetical protein
MTNHRLAVGLVWAVIALFCSLPFLSWAADWWRKEFKRRGLGGELYERREDGEIVEKDEPSRYRVDID